LLSKKKIDAIYSTDYKRTKATAQPTATNHGLNQDMIQRPSHILKYRKTYIDSRPFNTALEIIEAAGGTNIYHHCR
jgi:broad specificity phosphatase PhoE